MAKLKILHRAVAIIVAVLVITSCNKLVEVNPPIDKIESELLFSDPNLATASVTGLYSRIVSAQTQFGSFVTSLYPALSADELINTSTNINYDQFYGNSIPTTSGIIRTGFYDPAYKLIYHANACIEGLAKSNALQADLKGQLTGEAKFMRAFCYFYLVNLFGDVPLIIQTDFKSNAAISRTPIGDVYQQIVNDLEEAKNLLPASYVTSGKYRPNKWTATALLARTYLYLQNWSKALDNADQIIGSNAYLLVSNPDNIFANNNSEAIWQLAPGSPTFVQEAQTFIPTSTTVRPAFTLATGLFNSFEANDKRKVSWVRTNTISSIPYNYPFKYRNRSSTTVTANTVESITVFRLAEQFLIRAEAKAQLNVNLPSAISDINIVRQRAGITPLGSSLSQSAVLTAIAQERRIELMVEWGHRWLDLKRTSRADAVLGTKVGWQSTDVLYPIPQTEILLNINLTQNPGY